MADLISMLAAAAGLAQEEGGETDPNFNQTVLLLHGDGTNGAQNNTFLDSSTNNFTITRNGNTTQGTFSPFSVGAGEWSNYFDGSTSARLTFASSSDFAFGTGAYTIEAFIYLNSYNASGGSVIFTSGTATNALGFYVTSTGALELGKFNVAAQITSSAADVPINQWVHVAVVRTSTSSNDTRIYVNGSVVATGTDSNDWTVTTTPAIGSYGATSYALTGYVASVRVVKGTAITPSSGGPTSPFSTSTSNQVLLTCYSNRFVDSNTATTAKAITVNGTIKVTPFSPFAPTAAYDASVNGGSGYFDGTGDYLSVSSNAAFGFGTNAFSVEFWFYKTAEPSTTDGLVSWNYLSGVHIGENTTGIFVWVGGTEIFTTSTRTPLNDWSHIALTRSGTTAKLFLNGVEIGSTTSTGSVSANNLQIGASTHNTAEATNGYISSVRISNVSRTITVPTAPYISDSNTVLLTNFTNAAIFDNTGKNNLETVGNAQIDTTTKKYGTGSMEFDGTGDNLKFPSSVDFDFGTGNWTIEAWVYLGTRTTNNPLIVGNSTVGFTSNSLALVTNNLDSPSYNDKFVAVYGASGWISPSTGSSVVLVSNVANSSNVWYHVALVRNGTSVKMYRDGVEVASASVSSTATFNWGFTNLLIGGGNWDGANSYFTGFIDDLRITKGVARYTSGFTPPTKEFPNL